MVEQELAKFWRELTKFWKSTSHTIFINRRVAKEVSLIKKSIKGFEGSLIANDLGVINRSIKKFNS